MCKSSVIVAETFISFLFFKKKKLHKHHLGREYELAADKYDLPTIKHSLSK